MSQYYTKTELRNEIKKLKAKKDGYETKIDECYTQIKSYLSGISSIREKINKIDDECNNLYYFPQYYNIFCCQYRLYK